jgi:hypothetical protein
MEFYQFCFATARIIYELLLEHAESEALPATVILFLMV